MNQTLRFGAIRAAAFALLLLGCSEVHAQVGGNLNGGGSGKTPTSTCGDSSHALSWDNSTKLYGCQSITGSAAAGGSTTQVQRNNGGALGGISGVISDGTKMTFSAAALELSGSTSGTVVLNAPATGGGTLTLPQGTTTLAAASNNLSFFSSTTSAQLATLLSDETGSGAAVFGTSPTIASPTFSGTVAGASTIPNSVLVNSAMTLCGTSTSLGGSLTASACLDSIGSTRGSVLYRGASGWAALTPGTSGDCLKSQGVGADPAYGGCGAGGSVSVTAASANIVINPTPGTGTFTIGATYIVNAQTGTSYTIQSTDLGKLVTFSNGSSVAVTVPQATSTFGSGASFDVQNKGAGVVTLTPTTSTVNGSASLALAQNQGCTLTSDGTNWQVAACTALGGSGVTSVAQSFTGGLISVSGSPVTSTGTLALTVAGTSGGIPYFSSSSAWASSGALTSGGVVLGGGAGSAPNVSAALSFASGTLTVGSAGATLGTLNLTGNTSGTISIKGQAAAGTYNFNLPTSAGSNGECLKSAGGGSSPMTFGSCGSGSAGFAHPGYATNFYYTTPTITRSDYAVNANQLYTSPFIAGATDTFTKISIRVKTAAGATACEVGYYANTNGRPGALIADLGNIATTSTGTPELTGLSIPVTAGNAYWLAIGCNGSPTLRATDTQNQLAEWFIGTDDADYGAVQLSGSWTYSVGGLPGTFPATNTATSKTPLIFLRK